MLGLIARMKVKEGMQQDFERVMGQLASQVRSQEAGCKLYALCKTKDPLEYVVMERYDNQEALTAHGQSPHMKEASPALGAVLDGRPKIEILHDVG